MKKTSSDKFYVIGQIALFILFLFNLSALIFSLPDFLTGVGYGLSAIGIIMVFRALVSLNRNLSPFPTPKPGAELIQTGLYKTIRHPIYSGILIACFGLSLVTHSGSRLVITVLLFILFYFKSQYEEERLSEKYPEYEEYKKNTGRFFPKYF